MKQHRIVVVVVVDVVVVVNPKSEFEPLLSTNKGRVKSVKEVKQNTRSEFLEILLGT
jgi:hypothetical protein